MKTPLQDTPCGIRLLSSSPRFAAVVATTPLTLGSGANTSIFGVHERHPAAAFAV
jgi:hypothetical protein